MKLYEKKTVTKEVTEIVAKRCDICGVESRHNLYGDNWAMGSYAVDEVEIVVKIKHRTGSNYPEGGSGDEFAPDICPTCFTEKVLPALRALGLKVNYVEWNW